MVMTPDQMALLMRTAVRGTFDPIGLLKQSPPHDEDLAFLARQSTEKRVGDDWRWTLSSDARQIALKQLPVLPEERQRFLDDNRPEEDDIFGLMLQRALRKKPDAVTRRMIAPARLGVVTGIMEEQVIFCQAVELLLGAGMTLPEWVTPSLAAGLRRSISIATRTLADASFRRDPFRGRVRERKFLKDFAMRGALAIVAAKSARIPGLDVLTTNIQQGVIPAVTVGGIGGSGKSALLNVVRQSLDANRKVTLINVDFDQPSLKAGNPGPLMLEFTRQLALVEAELADRLSQTRRNLRQQLGIGQVSSGEYETSSSAFFGLFGELQDLLSGHARLTEPLIFIMDTFEEVLVADPARLLTLSDTLTGLSDQVGFADIRLILAGRAIEKAQNVSGRSRIAIGARLELGELGTRAGGAKLADMFHRLGIDHLDLVSSLIDVFSSNPLVIEILASYCRDKNKSEIENLIASGKTGKAEKLSAEFAHVFLYSRILERIVDPELQQLAHPGLVLRRVTAELICDVLAGPCKLKGNVDILRARELLDQLRKQVWLVDSDGADAIVHRRDVRRLMLPLILQKPVALDVARVAADWYQKQPQDDSNELEGLYYRALAGDSLEKRETGTLRALADHLGLDVDDLPIAARALVKFTAGRKLTANEVEALPKEQKSQYQGRRKRRILAEGLESVSVASVAAADFPNINASAIVDASVVGASSRFPVMKSEAGIRSYLRTEGGIQDYFARGLFTQVASVAEAELLEMLINPTSNANSIDHPAYLAVLASDEVERAKLRHVVEGSLSSGVGGMLDEIRAQLSQNLRRALEGGGTSIGPLIAVRSLAIDPMRMLDQRWSERSSKDFEEPPSGYPPRSTAALRVAMALRHVRRSPQEVRLSLVHTFDSRLIEQLGDMKLSADPLSETRKRAEEMIAWYGELRSQRVNVRVTDLNRAETTATRLCLVIGDDQLFKPDLVVGRAAEFYGPARNALLQIEDNNVLPQAVAKIADSSPFWPNDLLPSVFNDPSNRSRAVASLVDIADRFGQLEILLDTANELTGTDETVSAVLTRYRGFRATWAAPIAPSPEAVSI